MNLEALKDKYFNTTTTTKRNLEAINEETWQILTEHAINTCYSDDTFATYTAREQMLAFVYTLFQGYSLYEEFLHEIHFYDIKNFKILKNSSITFIKDNIDYGTSIGEIQARTWWSRQYPDIIVAAILGLSYLWIKDTSSNKEQTDAGIDKFINWIYDIMQPNAIDSGIGVIQYLVELKQQHGRTK